MPTFDTVTFPNSRVATIDVGRIAARKHGVVGLFEVDVTEARSRIRGAIRAGRDISFQAWFIKTVADVIARDPAAQALRRGARNLVLYHDVDVALTIERNLGGSKVPLASVLKKANEKTIEDLCREIAELKKAPVASEKDYSPGRASKASTGLFFRLPALLRRSIWRYILGDPVLRKNTMGTVMITNVGIGKSSPGWIVPKTLHNLCIGIGSLAEKPWVHKKEIVIREILNLTVIFDHDAIDGMPAARFAGRLVEALEGAEHLGTSSEAAGP